MSKDRGMLRSEQPQPTAHVPTWGRTARLTYRIALGAFAVLWLAGIVFDVDPGGSSPLYAWWIVIGVLGFVALLVWLASEFVTGRRDRA